MKKGTIIIFFIVVIACVDDPPQLPVERDVVVRLLTDMHVAEATVKQIYPDKRDSMAHIYFNQILKIHELDESGYDSLMNFLHQNPGIMEEIYNEVVEKIGEREGLIK